MHRGGRRRPYEDDEQGGRYSKKRRTVSEVVDEDPLKTLIYDVGEKTKASVESSIEGVSKMLEVDLSSQKGKILETLLEVVTKQPEKCTIYSTLIGLLNAKNYNFGGEFIEAVVKDFKERVKKEEWTLAEYSLRFISDLVNSHVISATSLLQLYDTFMNVAFDMSSPQSRRDWVVFAILNCLPWVGRELYDKKQQTMERLMITIDNYMKKRSKKHHHLLRVWLIDDPHPQEEYLDCLWAQIEKLKMDGWNEKHIIRPYLAFDNILCEALQHNLPQIALPQQQGPAAYPLPYVVFRLFDYTDCPQGPVLPGAHSIERYLIERELKAILNKHHEDRRECVNMLFEYPHHHRVPLDHIIVEVILGELFRLPVPEYLEICYGSILLELCKRQTCLVSQALAQATEILFDRIETMNVVCVDRFVTWFAFHLSNNQFQWSWEDWARVGSMDSEQPKPKFVSEVVQKCIRLSYYERIADILSKSLDSLLPAQGEAILNFDKSMPKTVPGIVQALLLQTAFRDKASVEHILEILSQIPNPLDPEMEIGSKTFTHNPLAINVFAQTVFMLGSKTISHSRSAIFHHQGVFQKISEDKIEEAHLCILKGAYEVWKKDTQMLSIVVDLLLKYKIVSFGSVANWIFTKDMQPEFTRIYLWEILHMTIRKINKNIDRLSKQLVEAKEKVRMAENSSSDSDAEDKGHSKDKTNVDVPTEDEINLMEENLEAQQAERKDSFLIIFQRFIMILSEHIVQCDTNGKPFNTPWYQWTVGRLQEVFLQHLDQVYQYSGTLETLLFTQDLDKNILEIFEQFKALKA